MEWYRKLNSLANGLPTGIDKLLHVIGALILMTIFYSIFGSLVVSYILLIVVSFAKEYNDKNFDVLDFLSWLLGGIIFVIFIFCRSI